MNNTTYLKTGTLLKSPNQTYRIERVLGTGGFGITYLATGKVKYGNVYFNVNFAIKEHFMDACFRDENGVDVHCTPSSMQFVAQSREDFLNEAKRLQGICVLSQNIVHVNEAFEANGTAYYVMEYLDGGNPGKMDERAAIDLITQISKAIAILHDNKFLHLDIKPDNIVLKSDDNGTSYPVLIDFGITKHFDENGNPTTSLGAKGLSLGYAPIEQSDCIYKFAPTLDIYAIGATLLYLLTGQNPPSSVHLLDEKQQELRQIIPSSVSPSTRSAILHAMHPNKKKRTQNVRDFLKDLSVSDTLDDVIIRDDGDTKDDIGPDISGNTIKIGGDTVPLGKKKYKSGGSRLSNIALFVSVLLSIAGVGLADIDLFLKGIYCLLGIGGGLLVCVVIDKIFKGGFSLLLSLSVLGFILWGYFTRSYDLMYVFLTEVVTMTLLLIAYTCKSNAFRWILAMAFVCIFLFLGFVWYSYAIIHGH